MPSDSETNEPNESAPNPENTADSLSSQRVFKKCSPNNKLTLYLSSRDLVVSSGRIDRLQGVLLVDPDFVDQRKVYGQVTLTFRYGREDEEVMGLKFCNEAVMCLAQLYPPHPAAQPPEGNTPLQDALLKRLGPNAYPFSMEITPMAPPSVQLVPAKEYSGAPIGTSYDVRAYLAEKLDEKLHRRTTVRMGIRVVQRAAAPPAPYLYNLMGTQNEHKQRNKNMQKKSLFNPKSTLLQPNAKIDSVQNINCSPILDLKTSEVNTSLNKSGNNLAETEFDNAKTQAENDIAQYHNKNDISNKIEVEHLAEECEEKENKEETVSSLLDAINSNKTPSHVSFKDQLVSEESLDEPESADAHKPEENLNVPNENVQSSGKHIEKHEHKNTPPCGGKRPSLAAFLAQVPPPHATVEKPFLLSDGCVMLEASLDKAIYSHGEEVLVTLQIRNYSNKTVKRIKVFVVQHVDVCMFSNGKFKNVVASINGKDHCPVHSGSTLEKSFSLTPTKSSTKNWIALEDSYSKSGSSLASTVTSTSDNTQDRNVFAIYVTYYVKVKLIVSVMGGELSLKLPFTLMHTCSEFDPTWTRELGSPKVDVPASDETKTEKDDT